MESLPAMLHDPVVFYLQSFLNVVEYGYIEKEEKRDMEEIRIGNLSLCRKTFIGREATDRDLEICKWNRDDSKYTIASFEYRESEECYELRSVCDRLNDIRINWSDFGELVRLGYERLEEEENEDEEEIY